MRLLITGKTRSGKSTALERLVRTATQQPWAEALIIDGKAARVLRPTDNGKMRVTNAVAPEAVAELVTAAAARLEARFQALLARGLNAASAGSPRELLVIDEVQTYTRHPQAGKLMRQALITIFEKSAALDDLVILASQRSTGAVPPGARINASAELRLLGAGHFQLVANGVATRQGRLDAAAPLADPETLSIAELHIALSARPLNRPPTAVTRYEGVPGSGRTHALAAHPTPQGARRIYLDVRAHTHKSLIVSCLEACGACPPEKAKISELVDAAALALGAEPTLLLLDNVDAASAREIDSLHRLLDAASVAAIGITPPPATKERDTLATLRRRAAVVELQPLDREQAAALARQVAPAIDAASTAAVVQHAHGNPQAIVAYAGRVAAHGDDERHKLEGLHLPARWLNLLIMFAALVVVILIQRSVAHDVAGAVLTAVVVVTIWYIRPKFREATR